jgi:hypothetical protein
MSSVVFHTQQTQHTPSKQTQSPLTSPTIGRSPVDALSTNIYSNTVNANILSSNTKKRHAFENIDQSPSHRKSLFSNNYSPNIVTTTSKTKRFVSKVSEDAGSVENLRRLGKKVPNDYLPTELLKPSVKVSVQLETRPESPKAMSEDDDLDFVLPPALFYEEEQKEKKAKEKKEKVELNYCPDRMEYSYHYNISPEQEAFLGVSLFTSDEEAKLKSENTLSVSNSTPLVIRTSHVNIIERRLLSTVNKRPVIISNDDETLRTFEMNGSYCNIKLLTQGNNHCVYNFVESEEMKRKVLKFALHIKGGSIPKINSDAEASYKRMQESGVPLPIVYAMPSTFVDTHNHKNGGFWIIEKMKEEVTSNWSQGATVQTLSAKEKEVVEFVKTFLTRSAITGKEVINDFYPRNVMRNEQDKLCIVDFSSEFQGDEWECETNMFKYLLAWSNGNEHIWNYLIADFPVTVAQRMTEILNAEKAKHGGAFPPSSQLKA